MIGFLAKLTAIGVLGACVMHSSGNVSEQVENIASLPKRVMTVSELKQIHRLIQYELAGGSSVTIEMQDFCRKNLSASGRDPGKDYWETPYRLFFRSSIYNENSSAALSADDADNYMVVSAGQDKKFLTKNDLSSKTGTDPLVRELTEQIQEEIKAEAKSQKSPGRGK